MPGFAPQYLFEVYADDGSTLLTPVAGGSHSAPFRLASFPGYPDSRACLDGELIEGFRGRVDPVKKVVEGGQWTVEAVDEQTGSDQSRRFLTEYVSDASGRRRLVGRLAVLWERLRPTNAWRLREVGRVQRAELTGTTRWRYTITDAMEEVLRTKVFDAYPAEAASGGTVTHIPLGVTKAYGRNPVAKPLRVVTKFEAGDGGRLQVDTLQSDRFARADNRFTPDLVDGDTIADDGTIGADTLQANEVRIRFSDTGQPWHGKEGRAYRIKVAHRAQSGSGGSVARTYDWIEIDNLPQDDPLYTNTKAIPSGRTLGIVGYRKSDKPTDEPGIVVDDANPLAIVAQILDGLYSRPGINGQRYPIAAYDTSRVNAATLPRARWVITDESAAGEWIERHVCQAYGLGYYVEPALVNGKPTSRLTFIDMRRDSILGSLATLPLLTDADRCLDAWPKWTHDANSAAKTIAITAYQDYRNAPQGEDILSQWASVYQYASNQLSEGVLPAIFKGRDLPTFVLDASAGAPVASGTLEIDALGLRASPYETVDGQKGTDWVAARVRQIAGYYWPIVESGPAYLVVECVRSSAIAEACWHGDWMRVNVATQPNAATRRRGGERLMQCIGREERQERVVLTFIDWGDATNRLGMPSLSGLTALTGNTKVRFSVGLNNGGNPVEVQFALVDAGAAAPAADSYVWRAAYPIYAGQEGAMPRITAGGQYDSGSLVPGMRAWFRARSVDVGGVSAGAGGQPSEWTAPQSVDLGTATVPTGVAVAGITTRTATVSWTNTDAVSGIVVAVQSPVGAAWTTVAVLPAGASQWGLTGLDAYPSQNMLVGVQYVPDGLPPGPRATAALNISGGSAAPVAPAITAVRVVRGTL